MSSASAKEFLITTVLVCAFVGLSFGLECYYCDPADRGCDDPDLAKRPNKNCDDIRNDENPMTRVLNQERKRVDPGQEISYLCAAVKVQNKENVSFEGFYRTCVVNTTTADHCNIFKDEFKDEKYGNVVGCRTCNESMCNSWITTDFKNSSPESFTAVLLYTFLSCFFVIYVI